MTSGTFPRGGHCRRISGLCQAPQCSGSAHKLLRPAQTWLCRDVGLSVVPRPVRQHARGVRKNRSQSKRPQLFSECLPFVGNQVARVWWCSEQIIPSPHSGLRPCWTESWSPKGVLFFFISACPSALIGDQAAPLENGLSFLKVDD